MFEGRDLLQWMGSVCGGDVWAVMGVCEALLHVGVLEKIGGGGELFAPNSKYGWTGKTFSYGQLSWAG